MKFLDLFSRETPEEPLAFLLLQERKASADRLHAIRMAPSAEFGGAWASVGPAISIPWLAILERGVEAFEDIDSVPVDSEGNTDMAPRTGKLRRCKSIFVKISSEEVVLSPEKRKGGLPVGAREDENVSLKLPASGEALEQALREAFRRAQ